MRHATHDDIIDRAPWANIGRREVLQNYDFPNRFHQKNSSRKQLPHIVNPRRNDISMLDLEYRGFRALCEADR
jgi:hypothetical protein